MKNTPVPLPFDLFPGLPAYQINTNEFLIDDRSVDYVALAAQQQAEAEAEGLTNQTITPYSIDTNGLWIQVPTNSLATNGYFCVYLMNTIQDQPYDVLTTPSLTAPNWATEQTVTGAAGNVTPVQMPMNNRASLFLRARPSVAYSFYLITEPLSQYFWNLDTVTVSVETGGNPNLTYQWMVNGGAITGATNNTFTIVNANRIANAKFTVIISDGTNSIVTAAAHLIYAGDTEDNFLIPIWGSRQDYTFRSGITYYISQPTRLYGNTTIEPGAVIKFDRDNAPDSSLLIMGSLTCKTELYNPAILTSIDDDSAGEWIYYSTGSPQTVVSGMPYLDMTSAAGNSISNLRFCFADWGVTTPVNSAKLDVWDCQFVQCNYGVVNLVDGNSTDSLHNVLFSACGAAVGASSNTIAVQGEHVTANVGAFCLAYATPRAIALTNSIIWGNALSASSVSTVDVTMNPDLTNFVWVGEGNFYLAGNSPLRVSGTAGISPRLQAEFKNKTTSAPIAIAAYTQISGQISLSPQAGRYTGGAPDRGYYYDALDYTVASLNLSGGSLTVLPGTAIGFRNEYIPSARSWTELGFFVNQGGSVTSRGTPSKPNVFVLADLVQETPNIAFAEYQVAYTAGLPGIISFLTDFETNGPAAPSLDFRFSSFYLPSQDMHFCSGLSMDYMWPFSANSVVFLNLQDCNLHDGQINLGAPDSTRFPYDYVFGQGAVTWNNSLFDHVSINLDPTYNEYGLDDRGLNVDLSFEAHNNLFRAGQWFRLEPVPASAGNWLLEDNFFDKVDFYQDTRQPLDFDYNGYWPLQFYEAPYIGLEGQLLPTANNDGFTDAVHEQVLASAPPYQSGPFGNCYLPGTTPLYGAGSRSAGSAGLAQYATGTNQTKEGATHQVNIGLHYVAANSFGQPLDSDSDGIPDYMEDANCNGVVDANETNPNNPMTDGVTADASNSVYLDTDLSGDGLVGRVKAALGMNPLDPNNPLTLKQVITGQEPDIATFELPISYGLLTNIGGLSLNLNGLDVTLKDIVPAADGNSLVEWNTPYDPPGQHYLQAQFSLNGNGDDTAILSAVGTFTPFYSGNVMQFFENDSLYDANSAFLDAQLPAQNANYMIQLYDPSTTPETLLATITNSTTNGMIQEDWNLTYNNGASSFTGAALDAVFNVTLLPPSSGPAAISAFAQTSGPAAASGTNKKRLTKIVATEQGNNFDFVYMYTPTNNQLASAFYHGSVWTGMQGVVDILSKPAWPWDVYNSYFDLFTWEGNLIGYPGYITSQTNGFHSVTAGLYPDMANGLTKNFYCYAHGSVNRMADYINDVYISAFDVANLLGNHYHTPNGINGGLTPSYPYRFVFLDGCSTASAPDWRRAFGIMPIWATNQAARYKLGPQAFVGWATIKSDYLGGGSNSTIGVATDLATAYTITLQYFYLDWMNGATVAQCILDASNTNLVACPLPVPQIKSFVLDSGNRFTNSYPSAIYVVGHSGLTVTGLNSQDDYSNAAPRNIQ